MKDVRDITDSQVAKALAHPLRARILAILEQRVATPKELAAELDTSLEALSYHVRMLAQLGLIRLVEERQKRGAIEHHYRAAPRVAVSDAAWARGPKIARRAMVGTELAEMGELACGAAAGDGFERKGAQLTRRTLQLDDDGFKEASAAVARLNKDVEGIERRAAKRLSRRNGGHAVDAGFAVLLFEIENQRHSATG
jgi:DNA-binding transcriptional ArsR family regulator